MTNIWSSDMYKYIKIIVQTCLNKPLYNKKNLKCQQLTLAGCPIKTYVRVNCGTSCIFEAPIEMNKRYHSTVNMFVRLCID